MNTSPKVQPGWKIRPKIAPTTTPRAMPGIAGNLNAIAVITIIGGINKTGLI